MNSKLTLIIDGNWLLMSRAMKVNDKFKSDKEFNDDLHIAMTKAVGGVLRMFPDIDNIMFVTDNSSWRKNLPLPKFLQDSNITYKGNRHKPACVNWDAVFEGYREYIQVLDKCGINVYNESGVEGDDWCWYWSSKLNAEGTNVIIWTRDRDLTQLVRKTDNGCFTMWWNRENGGIIEDREESDLDFVFNFEFNDNYRIYNNILKKTNITKIVPRNIVVDKIFRGDESDNIIPPIKRVSKTNPNKFFRITEKELDYTIDIYNDKAIHKYVVDILDSKKFVNKVGKPIEDIMEHIRYNRQMVALDVSSYTNSILNKLYSYKTYSTNKDLSVVMSTLTATKDELTNILEEI